MFKFFKKNKSEKEPKDLEEVLAYMKELENNISVLSKDLQKLKKESRYFFKKVGLIRFNPFQEVGGNQSFSMALLDGNNDGIIISSLYTREGNRTYGKFVKRGKSQHPLSKEEEDAMKQARARV